MNQANLPFLLKSGRSCLLLAEVLFIWAIANYSVFDPLTSFPKREPLSSLRSIREKILNFIRRGAAPVSSEAHGMWLRREPRRWFLLLIFRTSTATCVIAKLEGVPIISLHSVFIGAFFFLFPICRLVALPEYYWAEIEVVGNVLFVAFSGWQIFIPNRTIHWPFFLPGTPLMQVRCAALLLIAATSIIVVTGGSFFVRGILHKTNCVPPAMRDPVIKASEATDENKKKITDDQAKEMFRGHIIGALERILLLAIIAAGQYQALAFLAAAKALIRAKDIEDRSYAEYIITGTFASVLAALIGGLLIKSLFLPLLRYRGIVP